MKKKVKMTCILKSGQVVKDSFIFKKSDKRAFRVIEQIRLDIENYLAHPDKYTKDAGCIVFGKSTILMSEIAAITFREN